MEPTSTATLDITTPVAFGHQKLFALTWSQLSKPPSAAAPGLTPAARPYRPGPCRSPRAGCSRNPPLQSLHHEGPSATFMPIVSTTAGALAPAALAPSSSPPRGLRDGLTTRCGGNLPNLRICAVLGSGHPTAVTPPLPHRTSTNTPTPYRHFVLDNYLAEPATWAP